MKKYSVCLVMVLCAMWLSAVSGAEAKSMLANGIYEIYSISQPELVVDVRTCTVDEDRTDGTQVQMYQTLDANQQKFYVKLVTKKEYCIGALTSGFVFTGSETDAQAHTGKLTLTMLSQNEEGIVDPGQRWRIRPNADGSFYIKAANEPSYLTLDDEMSYNGTTLSMQKFTGEDNQRWGFRESWIGAAQSADTDLVNPYAEYGKRQNTSLAMVICGNVEVLTAENMNQWLQETESHEWNVELDAFRAYAEQLAEKYNTQGVPRKFVTHAGKTITMYKGDYGWALDTEATAQALLEKAQSGGNAYVEPQWKKKAKSYVKGDDIGDSYVEVDLSKQKVWLYENGECLLETDCVTGTYGTERETPGGVYSLSYKQSPAVLNGPGYSSPVQYWMPFNGGIGLHDASWRSQFGGEIYRSNGSHGCVNLPTEAAKKIYETVSKGYPIVCHLS